MPINRDNLKRNFGRGRSGGPRGGSASESQSHEPSLPYARGDRSFAFCRVPVAGVDAMALREHRGSIYIWWFPPEFCQSLYGENRDGGTNSCTLISLLLADKVSKERHRFLRSTSELPRRAVELFSTAINEANGVYKRCFSNRPNRSSQNLNIPDAMSSLERQPNLQFGLQEWFYTHLQANPSHPQYSQSISQRLANVLQVGIEFFQKHRMGLGNRAPASSRFLFAALIGDSRTMSLTLELPASMIAVFDSHQHGRKAGALIALAKFCDIVELMKWLIDMQMEIYSSKPAIFELSLLTTLNDDLPMPRNVLRMAAK